MTSPRPDFLETLRQMAQKPDATRTPDPKASFDDLMRQLTGGGTVSNRYEGLRPAISISQSAMPDYIGGPAGAEGAAAKLAAEVPAGQSGMLGALKRLVAPQQGPLVQAGKEGIEAWHGSPYRGIEKFDMEKIGTGEGAQAYGHGFYFADNPEVAKLYRANRAYVGKVMSGQPSGETFGADWIAQNAIDEAGTAEAAIAELERVRRANAPLRNLGQAKANAEVDAALEKIRSGAVAPRGALYKTRLDVTPDELLDWDNPLAQQPQRVRDAIRGTPLEPSGADASLTMGERYKRVMNQEGDFGQYLRERGVPGLRYLDRAAAPLRLNSGRWSVDAMSGGQFKGEMPVFATKAEAEAFIAPKQSRNYVMFDPERIKILEMLGLGGVGALGAKKANETR